MHPIFQTRDILDEICFWLREKDLAATIRVNKTWSAASVRPLWKSINLRDALKVLGPTVPLRSPRQGFYTFSRNIVFKWARFIYYAQHVRILRASGSDSFAILAAITSRPCSLKNALIYFFPNCQFLHWTTIHKQLDAVTLDVLIPPTLDHVYIIGLSVDHIWFNKFCKLVTRLPSLRVFRLDHGLFMDSERIRSSDSFYSLLAKFASTLTHVQIPEILFTQYTIEKLSQSPSLDNLSVGERRHLGEPVLMKRYAAQSEAKDLTSLKTLSFGPCMPQPLVLRFFDAFSFPAISAFHWHVFDVDFDIDTFLTTIVRTCPSLEILDLGAWGAMTDKEIPWSSARQLLGCKKLYSLALHCVVVDMTLDDLVELLRSRQAPLYWHRLEILSSQPFHFQDALLSVAKYCPRISTLGLRVHDQNSMQSFNNILPLKANEMNAQAQLEFINQVRQAGFSFPSLSILLLLDDSEFRPESAWPVASLLLAICQNRVNIIGDDMVTLGEVVAYMAEYYEEVEKLSEGETLIEAKWYSDFYRYQQRRFLI